MHIRGKNFFSEKKRLTCSCIQNFTDKENNSWFKPFQFNKRDYLSDRQVRIVLGMHDHSSNLLGDWRKELAIKKIDNTLLWPGAVCRYLFRHSWSNSETYISSLSSAGPLHGRRKAFDPSRPRKEDFIRWSVCSAYCVMARDPPKNQIHKHSQLSTPHQMSSFLTVRFTRSIITTKETSWLTMVGTLLRTWVKPSPWWEWVPSNIRYAMQWMVAKHLRPSGYQDKGYQFEGLASKWEPDLI